MHEIEPCGLYPFVSRQKFNDPDVVSMHEIFDSTCNIVKGVASVQADARD